MAKLSLPKRYFPRTEHAIAYRGELVDSKHKLNLKGKALELVKKHGSRGGHFTENGGWKGHKTN